jgi:protein-L-isoaspartate(D-aspartate) O-methyltransferase
MSLDLDLRRRFFAEELEAVARLRSAQLVDAFATVPRERFLPAGPWIVLSDGADSYMVMAGIRTRPTADADPARVYHNVAVAIDPDRQLFNAQPGTLAVWIDTLELASGMRVLHVGAGLGYYTAVMAACVGAAGRVVAYEVDEALTRDAIRNLAPYKNVALRCGDGSGELDESFDAILVTAGVTHPLETWLDALAPGGRLMVPITTPLPAMGATLGKGVVVLITRQDAGAISARVVTFVAIYSALGIRDPALDERIGKALMAGPGQWQAVKRLRRDPHDVAPSCWLHTDTCCFSSM